MTATTTDSKRLTSDQRREQLIEVAAELFARGGYEATTMDQVAQAAGVTKPLLYQHFDSKHALYEELITSAATTLLDGLTVAASPDTTAREKVERGFAVYFTMLVSDDVSFRLLLAESTDKDIARHLDAIEEALIEFIDPLIDAGLDADHRRFLAAAVVGCAKSAATFWLAEQREGDEVEDRAEVADRLARRCAQLVWGGLRSVSPS